jgi:hypothetical protein
MGVSDGKETLRPASKTSVDGSVNSTLAPSAEPSMLEKTDVAPPQTHPSNLLDEKSADGVETVREEKEAADEEEEDDYDYPKSFKLFLISLALCLSVFCMALVRASTLNARRANECNQHKLWTIYISPHLRESSVKNQ